MRSFGRIAAQHAKDIRRVDSENSSERVIESHSPFVS